MNDKLNDGRGYMFIDRINTILINRYTDAKIQKKKYVVWCEIVICIFLFLVTMVIQARHSSESNIGGVIAQVQVIISTYLVVSVKKRGYLIAVGLNIIESIMAIFAVYLIGNKSAIPGIIVPLGTIITVSIISLFGKRLNHRLKELTEQKEELSGLYEEVSVTEEESRQQNIILTKYNAIMIKNEEKLNYLAFTDVLTKLPNRKMIINRINQLVMQSRNKQEYFSVVFIDLDNFKRINDSRGHHIGDLLLQASALRLQTLISKEDMLGRLGGDEFALIIQSRFEKLEIFEYVESLRTVIIERFMIENSEFIISASFGISVFPQDGNDSADLLKCADTAMYKAKEHGKNGIQFFNKKMKAEVLQKIEFESRLISSIQNEEIFLVYQPQYSADTKRLKGFEALARWQSPELGLINPMEFIPVAEETGYIILMGEWILRTACKMFKYIQDTYKTELVIAVNISSVQIVDPSFIQMVKNVLDETKLSGEFLELEITESVFISSVDYVVDVFNELKEMGVRIALDDFGTGYSSLSYLQKLPINLLKIDKSFINSINKLESNKQIVGSIISLVHKMGILVVAEGVENEEQLEYLKNYDCDYIQGFLWGRPLSENDLYLEVQKLIN